MQVEYTEIITIKNLNFNLCGYFNNFIEITDTVITINNKKFYLNKTLLRKYSEYFNIIFNEHQQENYLFDMEYPIYFIEKVLSYIYGCDLIFNINFFGIVYKIADVFMMSELIESLNENLREGFENNKYSPSQAVTIIIDLFSHGNTNLNNNLFETLSYNFSNISDILYLLDSNILESIISRDDLNIKSETQLIMFLNKYYVKYRNMDIEINTKLIPHIRILTLSLEEIKNVSGIDLMALSEYKKLIDRSLLSKQNDFISNAHLILKYPNISTQRYSVIINVFNYFYQHTKLNREDPTFSGLLESFPAIVMEKRGPIIYGTIELRTIDNVIRGRLHESIKNPKVGSMIIINNYLNFGENLFNTSIIIYKYDTIFENTPRIFYEKFDPIDLKKKDA